MHMQQYPYSKSAIRRAYTARFHSPLQLIGSGCKPYTRYCYSYMLQQNVRRGLCRRVQHIVVHMLSAATTTTNSTLAALLEARTVLLMQSADRYL
jgi:hypothetical protein